MVHCILSITIYLKSWFEVNLSVTLVYVLLVISGFSQFFWIQNLIKGLTLMIELLTKKEFSHFDFKPILPFFFFSSGHH